MKKEMVRKGLILTAIIVLFSACDKKPVEKKMVFEQGSWTEILAKARKENKPVFLDAYAEWCGPCKWMAAQVFTDSAVAVFYNKKFINAKIDMEKGEGVELAKRYGVRAYPTLLYLNAEGEVLHRVCGSMPPQEFIKAGETALNPDQRFAKLQNEYRRGNRNTDFLMTFLEAMEKACMNTDSVKDEYFALQKDEQLSERINWNIFYQFENNPESRMFQYVMKNRTIFDTRYTRDSVDEKIYTVMLQHYLPTISNDTAGAVLAAAKKAAVDLKFSRSSELALEMETSFYAFRNRWNDYAAAVTRLIEQYKMNQPDAMARAALRIVQNVDQEKYLKKAESWAKTAVEKDSKPYYLDVYAQLLFKNGKKEEAIRQEERAIQLAKERNMSTEKYEKNLERFRQ